MIGETARKHLIRPEGRAVGRDGEGVSSWFRARRRGATNDKRGGGPMPGSKVALYLPYRFSSET
eukprot:14292834-Heterocapsa_arctica.AAC.1